MNVGDHVLVACIMVEGNGVVHRQTHDPPKNQVRANLCLNVSFQQKHEKSVLERSYCSVEAFVRLCTRSEISTPVHKSYLSESS